MRDRYIFAQNVAVEIKKHAGYGPVFAPDYQWVAHLRFQGIDAHQLAGVWRPSHFTQKKQEKLADYPQCLFFSGYAAPAEFLGSVVETNRVGPFEFRIRGEESGIYQLWFYQRRESEPAQP